MNAVMEFLAMGGDAFYVWGAFGMTFGLVGVEAVLLVHRIRRAHRALHQEQEPPDEQHLTRAKWERTT